MTTICPGYVLDQFMTSIYLQNPSIVLVKSSLCPGIQTFVLFLSSDIDQISQKIGRQNLDKDLIQLFSQLPPRHPAGGQRLDNL